MKRFVLGIAVACLVFARGFSAEDSSPIATTTAGKIRGYVDQGIHAFKGIPYGGDTAKRRVRAPVPPTPWEGVRDALEFAPMAPQGGGGRNASEATSPGRTQSEDCLHLNVWTPALRD